ncbi:MAG: alanine racemase [Candidatus Helarchaeota archaeon]
MEQNDPRQSELEPTACSIKRGEMIIVSGQEGLPAKDIVGQTRNALNNVKQILEKEGSSIAHIVKMVVFLKNINDFEEMNIAYAKFFRMNGITHRLPARTTVEMPRLPKESNLIIIDATAFIETTEKTWKDDVSTPALIIYLDKLKRNIEKMARFARDNGVNLRPHVKTHKCPEIARMQLEAGASGICVAKVAEAEVFVEEGFRDILIANQIIGRDKIQRLANLNKKAKVRVAVDSHENVHNLNEIAIQNDVVLEVLIDIDVGLGRTGVRDPDIALELAEMIRIAPGLKLVGLQAYEGHLTYLSSMNEKIEQVKNCMNKVIEIRDLLNQHDHDITYITAGGSGTFMITGKYPGITEIQPGTYVFWDHHMNTCCPDLFEQSLTILATINNQTNRRKFTLDMGSKSCSVADGKPTFKNHPKARMEIMTEEHGQFKKGKNDKFRIGQKVELIPAHVCPTVNLYDEAYILKDDKIIKKWKILARGKNY